VFNTPLAAERAVTNLAPLLNNNNKAYNSIQYKQEKYKECNVIIIIKQYIIVAINIIKIMIREKRKEERRKEKGERRME
jgi:hypothetical protein